MGKLMAKRDPMKCFNLDMWNSDEDLSIRMLNAVGYGKEEC